MAGSREGGLKASKTNKEKYGDDFYRRIGAEGGSKGTTGGFFADRELSRIAGTKGGQVSKRGFRFCGYDSNGNPKYIKNNS